MKRPGEDLKSEPRQYYCPDLSPDQLLQWAYRLFSRPRISILFATKANALIFPNSLRGVFTDREMQSFREGRDDVAAYWDIADLSDALYCRVPYFRTNPEINPEREKPFELTMSVSHMADRDGTVVEATPSNIVQLHGQSFSTDPDTQRLIAHITRAYHSDPAIQTALLLEIRGEFPDEGIKSLNHFADGNNMLGYKHVTRFQRPYLGLALQSAISRQNSPYPSRSTSIITTATSHSGLPIVVHSTPDAPITVSEGFNPHKSHGIIPTTTFMVRPRFPRHPVG